MDLRSKNIYWEEEYSLYAKIPNYFSAAEHAVAHQ